MNALLLGGNGFIGSHLVDRLLCEQNRVRVFDRREEFYRDPIVGVEYCYGDYDNRTLLAEALQNIDTVFHLNSTTLPKTSNDDPAFDLMSNVVETIHLLEQCVEHGIKKIVFLSSGGTVYGRPASVPVSEYSQTNPACSYGMTKLRVRKRISSLALPRKSGETREVIPLRDLTIERYLALFHHLYRLDYVVVRPSNPYGARQNPKGIQGAISVFLGKIAEGEPIEIWGDGEIVRDYVYIKDLVEGIYQAATRTTTSRVFILGSGEGHSLNAIVAIIRKVVATEVNVVYTAGRSVDVPTIYLDISRAERELDWRPQTPLNAGIQETWRFVKNVTAHSTNMGN